ncbi:exodeoxyribonuclease V subunit gamma [Roseateles sp.]|uniref:exodeoxyribonuclease V subunit gamma n=1 Tax=Roseateles sp. TaxID=1971397 RepID=UPI003D1215E1
MSAIPLSDITPGLLVLHGNRAELLGDAVFEWLRRSPLRPLEEEVLLVQSNGVAEWLKMQLASQRGICAATRVELPARFMWRTYRQLLGRETVPPQSPLDKLPLTWRLMRLLPELLESAATSDPQAAEVYAPLADFLQRGGLDRRLQLAQRLADLYDQYQIYRSDWLDAWGLGHDVLPAQLAPAGEQLDLRQAPPLAPDQRWQAWLWRALLQPLSAAERAGTRPVLHQRFMQALLDERQPPRGLPRRLVLFGMTHVPQQTLQALAALARHCQVILALPNPCRYHWADIIDGRELLRQQLREQRRRQPLRQGRDLAELPLEEMHAHAHPLLAAWGRQGRDFVRALDAFDDAAQTQARFPAAKIDLFDEDAAEGEGCSLLQQVQARIRDLVPLAEHAGYGRSAPEPALLQDRSIVFHIAHGAQREVEILHDQLLSLLAAPPPPGAAKLQPRDIVVMLPNVEGFAPAIRSVFGQYARSDARHIPFDIADLSERGNNPLMVALEWLLRLPQARCTASELRDLLDVPGLALRFGLEPADLPRLAQWISGAGIRWGLNAGQRASLGLAACGEQNSWAFGLRRMLLGFASGQGEAFQGIEPYGEIGGLEAHLAGSLADLLGALLDWQAQSASLATPAEWAARGRALLETFFEASDERERLSLSALNAGLSAWLEACEAAGFVDQPVDLAVAREAWLDGVDEPGLNKRFRAGGVTFCTLMPMRAVPFEVVCLLGMNDGDYPRRSTRSDFDLMGLPGQLRPGDRSRRLDDRQLLLEALLSARRQLYISWSGRSARDNSEQPPSVLVSQLRDYLAAGWGQGLPEALSTEHPLQPFSRRYFEQPADPRRLTHAREWRDAHLQAEPVSGEPVGMDAAAEEEQAPLKLVTLVSFLRNPVREFFRRRLNVHFEDAEDEAGDDAEAFALDGLQDHSLLAGLLDQVLNAQEQRLQSGAPPLNQGDLAELIRLQAARLQRAGRLPMAELGRREEQRLAEELLPMLDRWLRLQADYPDAAPKAPLRLGPLDDWLDGLQQAGEGLFAERVWLQLLPSRMCGKAAAKGKPPALRMERLIAPWVRMLAASSCGFDTVPGVLVGRDAWLQLQPLSREEAQPLLADLIALWQQGMQEPLPLAPKTALAFLDTEKGKPAEVFEGGGFASAGRQAMPGEGEEMSLTRVYPSYAALCADGRFANLAQRLFGPLRAWAEQDVVMQLHQAAEGDALNLEAQP